MSTDEIYRGFDHGDPTEAWRVEAVHAVETHTVPNMLPADLTPDEADYMGRKSHLDDAVKMMLAAAIFLGVANVIALVTLIFGRH